MCTLWSAMLLRGRLQYSARHGLMATR